jgi:hypothetical protein
MAQRTPVSRRFALHANAISAFPADPEATSTYQPGPKNGDPPMPRLIAPRLTLGIAAMVYGQTQKTRCK